ncbi:MAG: hypothetical protein HY650_10455 [Acidobacteria bacterium]|nr:hypothetical protein [Acidobacteriota bacterium]
MDFRPNPHSKGLQAEFDGLEREIQDLGITSNGHVLSDVGIPIPSMPDMSELKAEVAIRDGVLSTCATPKACSIFTAAGSRNYDAYSFVNSGLTEVCVTVTLTVPICSTQGLMNVAYIPSYDPSSPCTNHVADVGFGLYLSVAVKPEAC